MIIKSNLINSLKDFPEKFSIDDLMEKLIILDKIEKGLEQSEKNEVLSTEEAKEKLEKWLK